MKDVYIYPRVDDKRMMCTYRTWTSLHHAIDGKVASISSPSLLKQAAGISLHQTCVTVVQQLKIVTCVVCIVLSWRIKTIIVLIDSPLCF